MIEQRDAAWVAGASPEQIAAANRAGELAHYQGLTTDDERAHEAHVNESRDRLFAEALGFASHGQLSNALGYYGTGLFESKRNDMTPAQREKFDWLRSASPAEAYAAEQAGELDNLLGRDVDKEAARLAEIGQKVRDSMGGLYA